MLPLGTKLKIIDSPDRWKIGAIVKVILNPLEDECKVKFLTDNPFDDDIGIIDYDSVVAVLETRKICLLRDADLKEDTEISMVEEKINYLIREINDNIICSHEQERQFKAELNWLNDVHSQIKGAFRIIQALLINYCPSSPGDSCDLCPYQNYCNYYERS